ncbi:MAG: hypothetical protein OI715_01350 (plasmid) [Candidatus Methanoperedens sp.]|nr:MAG: hypothetical protein OI715_01350 [Candidatus Methanoperedens sp.]
MSAQPVGPRFKHIGDWLIWRSSGFLGDFRMPDCINIIASEGAREGWLYQLTDDDITRILARYKEHVSYWNVDIEVIRGELRALADALQRMFEELAAKFDGLQPRRIPPEQVFSYAQFRKMIFQPSFPGSTPDRWIPAPFSPQELLQLNSWLYSQDQASSYRLIEPSLCEIHGSFTQNELFTYLQQTQSNDVQYEVMRLS